MACTNLLERWPPSLIREGDSVFRSGVISIRVREGGSTDQRPNGLSSHVTPTRRFAPASPIEGEANFVCHSKDLPPPFVGEAASVKRAGGGCLPTPAPHNLRWIDL